LFSTVISNPVEDVQRASVVLDRDLEPVVGRLVPDGDDQLVGLPIPEE